MAKSDGPNSITPANNPENNSAKLPNLKFMSEKYSGVSTTETTKKKEDKSGSGKQPLKPEAYIDPKLGIVNFQEGGPSPTDQLDIQINSQGLQPDLLQFELAYNPAVLTEVSITPKTTLKTNIQLNNNNEKTGRLSYAIYLPQSISSSETPVTLKFKVKQKPLK